MQRCKIISKTFDTFIVDEKLKLIVRDILDSNVKSFFITDKKYESTFSLSDKITLKSYYNCLITNKYKRSNIENEEFFNKKKEEFNKIKKTSTNVKDFFYYGFLFGRMLQFTNKFLDNKIYHYIIINKHIMEEYNKIYNNIQYLERLKELNTILDISEIKFNLKEKGLNQKFKTKYVHEIDEIKRNINITHDLTNTDIDNKINEILTNNNEVNNNIKAFEIIKIFNEKGDEAAKEYILSCKENVLECKKNLTNYNHEYEFVKGFYTLFSEKE